MEQTFEKELKELLENTTADAARNIFTCIKKICLATENKIDDMFIPLLDMAEKKLLEVIDKIDGEQG